MDEIELSLLTSLQDKLLGEVEFDQRLTAADLCHWHRDWLGAVYAWAGRYRAVNLQKDGFLFAAAHLLPKLMQDFEANHLSVFTPCHGMDVDALTKALAICHTEFIIIHPFREGNGRLSRMLANIMALQAGFPPLDFSWMAENRERYFAAIQAGHGGNYEPIRQAFSQVLQASRPAD